MSVSTQDKFPSRGGSKSSKASSVSNRKRAMDYMLARTEFGEYEELPAEAELWDAECSMLDKTYPKPTLLDYQTQKLDQTKLFDKVITQDKSGSILDVEPSCSLLVTGFGMRNLESLQECLEREENKRIWEFGG
ncbi:unnamed protein product [Acanthoscelides obtectus]|uniref:Uncharacterized protein n=1 Tax=Acanthoscelides obtectus TaxID=200917 RepID=A0A9P0NQ12_ACAOB|nr:unnamed protein product [Acanthoscelides obtectus]CAK1639838.1 hypothetical protein AOBTE_LOCUS11404 [Acanthoscelides obtectus]